MKSEENDIEEILKRYLPSASQEEAEADCSRVLERLRVSASRARRQPTISSNSRRAALALAAAAVLLVLLGPPILQHYRPLATVESIDGGLYRIVNGKNQTFRVGEKLGREESVYSNGGSGGMIKLADGSLIEMRSKSALSLGRVQDGLQIRLNSGGVIVNAAKQRTGHLYVQTKDVRVSVVGTVFMVNAEEEGSRVAVIEGEVHVQQGATEKKLRPGEQVATNPKMESLPVQEEIAWSRNVETHLALLQQALPRNPTQDAVAFEVTSVRPSRPPAGGGGRGGGGGDGGPRPFAGCGGRAQFDPSQFSFHNATVYSLIEWAYERDPCPLVNWSDRITGGPAWIKSDSFDIDAIIPAGANSETSDRFGLDRPPRLQKMLQGLLTDRFNLVIHRETRRIPVYALTVAKGGSKLKPSTSASCVSPDEVSMERGSACGASSIRISAVNQATIRTFDMSLDQFAKILIVALDRPVLNKVDLGGAFDIGLEFAPDRGILPTLPVGAGLAMTGPLAVRAAPIPPSGSSIFTAVQEQLGLKLEPTTGTVEFFVIDRVEKPTEN